MALFRNAFNITSDLRVHQRISNECSREWGHVSVLCICSSSAPHRCSPFVSNAGHFGCGSYNRTNIAPSPQQPFPALTLTFQDLLSYAIAVSQHLSSSASSGLKRYLGIARLRAVLKPLNQVHERWISRISLCSFYAGLRLPPLPLSTGTHYV